jgi:hypothetical protein
LKPCSVSFSHSLNGRNQNRYAIPFFLASFTRNVQKNPGDIIGKRKQRKHGYHSGFIAGEKSLVLGRKPGVFPKIQEKGTPSLKRIRTDLSG